MIMVGLWPGGVFSAVLGVGGIAGGALVFAPVCSALPAIARAGCLFLCWFLGLFSAAPGDRDRPWSLFTSPHSIGPPPPHITKQLILTYQTNIH